MKNKILTIAFAVAIFALPAFSQKATRITFKKGATSTVVTGTLTGFKSSRTFVIRVKAGQVLTTDNAGSNHITVGIEAPPGSNYEQDMDLSCHSTAEVNPTVAGDYKITFFECQKADPFRGSFRLRVTVK